MSIFGKDHYIKFCITSSTIISPSHLLLWFGVCNKRTRRNYAIVRLKSMLMFLTHYDIPCCTTIELDLP